MMNSGVMFLLVCFALVGFVSATLGDDWAAFKSQHEQSEEAGYKLGLNHLSDWTESELKRLRGFKLPHNHEVLLQNLPEAEQFLSNILNDNSIEVPDSVDWRRVPGRVTPIKDQGYCGSCWAFASVGALEGQEVVRNSSRRLISLSEQNLVDCTKENAGCSGGWMKPALELVNEEGGIEDELAYPYLGHENKHCYFNKSKANFTDSGAAMLPRGDEKNLKEVVAKFGPVAVAIDARSYHFDEYHSGVYYNRDCSSIVFDHAMLVVGYGTDSKQGDYWIVKNSWGEIWGDKGYMLIARNRDNHCGVAGMATIPTF